MVNWLCLRQAGFGSFSVKTKGAEINSREKDGKNKIKRPMNPSIC